VSNHAQKKLARKEISRAQYDSTMNLLYKLNKHSFKDNSRVKKVGAYVALSYNYLLGKDFYDVYKFGDSGVVFASYQFDTLSNSSMVRAGGRFDRYTANGSELIVEYLLTRDFDLHNIFKYARMSENGDTLVFYKTQNLTGKDSDHKSERKEVYIYNPNLTAIPKAE
jgi:hypothetical protein